MSRNGKIRNFLAQTAAYVNHGSGANEEINLFGLDGSKPGAASAGVWLSHKVIGKFHIFLLFGGYQEKNTSLVQISPSVCSALKG